MEDPVASAARLRGGHTAVVADDGSATYLELDAAADGVTARLKELGVVPGDRVATTLAPGLAFVTLLHATARAGAALVPLNTRLAVGELDRQRADAAATLEVADPLEPAQPRGEPATLDPAAVRAVIFTSGTSGASRPVELTNANFAASAAASSAHLGSEPGDRWLAVLPFFHVGGLSIPLRAAFDRVAVIVHPAFDADRVRGAMEAGEVTLLSLVPTMLARLRDAGLSAAPGLRALLLGGGPSDPALVSWARQHGLPVLPTYGMTETTSQMATAEPGEPGALPLGGVELRIAGEGEILARGPIVAASALAADGWLHTGDTGRIDPEGRLHVEGRLKDTIVSGGENVSPVEVENALLSHPAVADAAVLGVPDAEWGEAVAAVVVLSGPAEASQLLEHCRSLLAPYKRPKSIRVVPELPRNAAGKLVRGDLPNVG